ncbi:MAG: hypothetical protein Q9220_006964 [cf. Caloplaca sp. 1 TL-2023]
MVIRLGIIGLSADPTAWATTTHVQPFKAGQPLAEHFKLTALATSNPDSAKAAAKAHGVPPEKAYSKPEDIANDADVDLVVVSVKVQLHKELAMPALQAKKDVFVEWPLGASLAEAEEMAALAKKQGVKTYVCLQARLQPVMVKAKEIIASGALGRITSTTVLGMDSSLMNLPEKARYINDPNSGASFLNIPSAHTLDPILHTLSSELSSLSATTSITHLTISFGTSSPPEPRRTPDSIAITGHLTGSPLTENAAFSFHLFLISPATPSLFQAFIVGEKGALKLEGGSFAVQMMAPRLFRAETPEAKEGEEGGEKGMYEKMKGEGGGGVEWKEVEVVPPIAFGGVGEVYDAIRGGEGRKDVVDFDEAVKRHRMLAAIERSARDGTRESYLV